MENRKPVLVTGISGTLGRAISMLAPVLDLEIRGLDHSWNLSIESEAQKAVESAGRIHRMVGGLAGFSGLIHCVGGYIAAPHDVSPVRRMMDVNFYSFVWTLRAAEPFLDKGARILAFTSPAYEHPEAEESAYAASKAALVAYIKAIGLKQHMTANVINLPVLDTPENREGVPEVERLGWVSPENAARFVLDHMTTDHAPTGKVLELTPWYRRTLL